MISLLKEEDLEKEEDKNEKVTLCDSFRVSS